jgi:mRNA interferase RelE/StbE
MSYRLEFIRPAQKEWRKLGATVQKQFKEKLAERLQSPRIPGDRLRGYTDHYKIKLRSSGYRLVYEVKDDALLVMVIAVGKRNRGDVYSKVKGR